MAAVAERAAIEEEPFGVAAAAAKNPATALLGVYSDTREGEGEMGMGGAVITVLEVDGPALLDIPLFLGAGNGVLPREEGELSLEDSAESRLWNNIHVCDLVPYYVVNEIMTNHSLSSFHFPTVPHHCHHCHSPSTSPFPSLHQI